MISEAKQSERVGHSTQAISQQTDIAADLHEVKRLEGEWEKCRQGMARMDEYRDFILQNAEDLRRWRNSFSDPIGKMPGGSEFAEGQEAEIRKTLAESDELYAETKSKYLARQKEIEGEIDAVKKRIAANRGAQSFTAERSSVENLAVGDGSILTSDSAAYGVADAAEHDATGSSAIASFVLDRGEPR